MEKEIQNYEYLIKYHGGVENDINTRQQIIIVQENGHLINAQEENTKEFENIPCPMLDASQQPIYFQLNNSSELIPISVDSLQAVEPSNAYENTFLLPSLAVEVIEPGGNVSNKHEEILLTPNEKDESVNMDVDVNKLPGDYAEITLSDEHYDILKRKGRILLEMNEKVILLDSSGLHEITNDHELISKLKHETSQIGNNMNQQSRSPINVTMVPENQNANANNGFKQQVVCETGSLEIDTGIEIVDQEEIPQEVTQESMVMPITHIPTQTKVQETELCDNHKIRIQSQFQLRDIPKEIVLGKTINGKNLIARVVEGKGPVKIKTNINKDMKAEVGRDRNITDKHFFKLVQQVLHGTAEKCRMEDIVSVDNVIMQVFQVPNLKPDLNKYKLIVTKTVRKEDEDGLIQNQSDPAVVTGRIIMNGNEGRFVHIPDMLQTLMKNSDSGNVHHNYNKNEETAISDEDLFLHINITETKDTNNISRVSVMINKRYLPLEHVYNMKATHINAVYACTACAKVFKMQEELEDHQQFHCSSVVPELNVDTAKLYTVVKARNKIKAYMCKECKVTFAKLNDCQEHLRTHYKDTSDEKHSDSTESKGNVDFKCKMCDISFLYSSSLTKHILAKHIMTKC